MLCSLQRTRNARRLQEVRNEKLTKRALKGVPPTNPLAQLTAHIGFRPKLLPLRAVIFHKRTQDDKSKVFTGLNAANRGFSQAFFGANFSTKECFCTPFQQKIQTLGRRTPWSCGVPTARQEIAFSGGRKYAVAGRESTIGRAPEVPLPPEEEDHPCP